MKDRRVQQLRTNEGIVLRSVPASVVRQGLNDGWLSYCDEVLVKNENFATLARAAGHSLWESEEQAAHRRVMRWGVYGAYSCVVPLLAIWIWSALPYLQGRFDYDWLDVEPFHRFFIVYCYLFWMLTPLMFRFSRLAGIIFPIMVAFSMGPLTGVRALDLARELGADALLGSLMAATVGYLAGAIAANRHEKARSKRRGIPIPESVRAAYEEGYSKPPQPIAEPEPPRPSQPAQQIPVARYANPNEPVTITLIHGTRLGLFHWFGRRQHWTGPDGFVRQSIEASFPGRSISFREFLWSGSNSHAARLKYSEKLRKDLLRAPDNLTNHFLLAHSHGGTVASYALRDPDLQSKIGGLATIGTPFLLTRTLSWGPMTAWTARIGGVGGASLLLWLGFGNFGRWFDVVCDSLGVPASDPGAWTCLFFILLFTLFGILFVLRPLVQLAAGRVIDKAKSAREKYVRLLDTANHPPVPILCVYDAADEARRWLRALNRAATLPERLLFRFSPVVTLSAAVIFIVLAGYVFAWWPDINTRYEVDWEKLPAGPVRTEYFKYRLFTSARLGIWISNLINSTASSLVIAVTLHVLAAVVLLAVVLAAQKLLVGSGLSLGSVSWYEIATSWLVRIRVMAHPRNLRAIGGRVVSISMSHWPLGGLKHSAMLRSPVVLREVATWLGERISAQPSLAHLGIKEKSSESFQIRPRPPRVRLRYVFGWMAAGAGLSFAIAAAAELARGQFERATHIEFVFCTAVATMGCFLLASPWLSRFSDRRRRAWRRLAVAIAIAVPLGAASWYARILLRTPVRVVVVTQNNPGKDARVLLEKLGRVLNPFEVGVRIVSTDSKQSLSCQSASAIGAERNAPVVIWLAPEPRLFHAARLSSRAYQEYGLVQGVPDIEDRCVVFPTGRDDLLIAMTRALVLLDIGASRTAASELEVLARDAPRSTHANYYAGLAEMTQHRPRAALAYWSDVQPSPEMLSDIAVLQASLRQYDRALQTLNQAIHVNPRKADFFVNRGNLYRITGDFRASQADFDQAAKLEPDTALRAYFRGLNLRDGGDEDGAEKQFAKSTEMEPAYIPPYLELHDYFNHRRAFRDYRPYSTIRAALKQSVTGVEGLYFKANAYEIAQRPQDAIQLYDRIIRLQPTFCEARVARVLVSLPEKRETEEHRHELQLERLKQISSDDSDCIEADYHIAILLDELHRAQESIDWYGKLIEKNWQTAQNHAARAQIYWENACREEAIAEFRQALQHPTTYQSYVSARDGLNEALTTEPFDPSALADKIFHIPKSPTDVKSNNGCRILPSLRQ